MKACVVNKFFMSLNYVMLVFNYITQFETPGLNFEKLLNVKLYKIIHMKVQNKKILPGLKIHPIPVKRPSCNKDARAHSLSSWVTGLLMPTEENSIKQVIKMSNII